MNKFNENFDYNDDVEDEDSIGVEIEESFNNYEYLGSLDCGIEKEYVVEQIKSIFKTNRLIEKDTARLELLKLDLENVVDEMLKYAVESGLLEDDGNYYTWNN